MSDNRNEIVAIVPAAGRGTRLHPYPVAKELFPLGFQDVAVEGGGMQKRPKVVSQYIIENMIRVDPESVCIILGEGKHDIMRYYGDGSRFDTRFIYFYQEVPSGMPVALDLAYPVTRGKTVVFGMPDTVIEPGDSLKRIAERHQAKSADLTLGLYPTDRPYKFGMVQCAEDGSVVTTVDKPKDTDLTHMWGCAAWSGAFTELLHEFCAQHRDAESEIVLGDVFNRAIEAGLRVEAVSFDEGRYLDIGTAEELDAAIRQFDIEKRV